MSYAVISLLLQPFVGELWNATLLCQLLTKLLECPIYCCLMMSEAECLIVQLMYMIATPLCKPSLYTVYFILYLYSYGLWVWLCCRYNVMLQCWHDSPGLRPSFSDLVADLDRFLGLCVSEVAIAIIRAVDWQQRINVKSHRCSYVFAACSLQPLGMVNWESDFRLRRWVYRRTHSPSRLAP